MHVKRKNNSKKGSTKISVSITKHGDYDTAVFDTVKSTIHTLNLPEGDEYVETVLNIDNNSDNDVIQIVGRVVCSENKKEVKGLFLYGWGSVQLHCLPSDNPEDNGRTWEASLLVNSNQVVFNDIDLKKLNK